MTARAKPGRARGAWVLGVMALLATGCAEQRTVRPEIRLQSRDYQMCISTDPMPPYAREAQTWRVVIYDRDSNQPIESGEGRIFASSRDGRNVFDGFTKAAEVGTFTGRLSFITAGEWAMAVEFRTDSLQPLQRVDWIQEVRPERPIGS